MAPRLVARWSGDNPEYARLARVLEASASEHCGDWVIDVAQSRAGTLSRYEGFRQKALDWWRAVRCGYDGERIALLDVDTAVLGSLDTVWERDFDLAVTVRHARERVSSGVVFVRRSDSTLAFFERWMRRTARLHRDERHFRFADQRALVQLLGECPPPKVIEIPCHLWNCERHSWSMFGPTTKIIHITTHLRRALFRGADVQPGSDPLLRAWKAIEARLE